LAYFPTEAAKIEIELRIPHLGHQKAGFLGALSVLAVDLTVTHARNPIKNEDLAKS
jgi:hypothetical protein